MLVSQFSQQVSAMRLRSRVVNPPASQGGSSTATGPARSRSRRGTSRLARCPASSQVEREETRGSSPPPDNFVDQSVIVIDDTLQVCLTITFIMQMFTDCVAPSLEKSVKARWRERRPGDLRHLQTTLSTSQSSSLTTLFRYASLLPL